MTLTGVDLDDAERCQGVRRMQSTPLNLLVVVADGTGRRVQFLGTAHWQCIDGRGDEPDVLLHPPRPDRRVPP
jgi:hypothetical protein